MITAVSDSTNALNLDSRSNLLDSRNCHQIEPQVILTAQEQDPSIGRVIAYKLNGHKTAIHEISRELPHTKKVATRMAEAGNWKRWALEKKV